jgi:peptidase E
VARSGETGTIIAMGGGGFTMRGSLSPLDRYVLGAARRKRPRVCLIATAGGDPAKHVRHFYRAFRDVDCVPAHLDVFALPVQGVDAFLEAQDVVYVGGGNTRNLLLLWHAWGVDRALRKACASGTVLAGVSAGALCWFREGITDSWPGKLAPLSCLGFIDASFSPHYDGEPGRRPAFHALIARARLRSGYAADDGVALRFESGVFREAVAEDAGKSAYHVARAGRGVRERALPTRLIS